MNIYKNYAVSFYIIWCVFCFGILCLNLSFFIIDSLRKLFFFLAVIWHLLAICPESKLKVKMCICNGVLGYLGTIGNEDQSQSVNHVLGGGRKDRCMYCGCIWGYQRKKERKNRLRSYRSPLVVVGGCINCLPSEQNKHSYC